MANPADMIPDMLIQLPNGISAELVLEPMPKADSDGRYPRFSGPDAPRQPRPFLTFRRDGKIIAAAVPWEHVISGEDSFTPAPDVTLGEDVLCLIESRGWGLMLEFGMYPTALVG